MEQLLTIEDVAELLQMPPRFVEQEIRMTKHRNPCRSHPRRVMVHELTLGKFICAGCLHNDEPEPDSIVAKKLASRQTSTPMLIEAIQSEYERQGTTLSRGMYLWLLTQDTKDIAIELDRLRTEA